MIWKKSFGFGKQRQVQSISCGLSDPFASFRTLRAYHFFPPRSFSNFFLRTSALIRDCSARTNTRFSSAAAAISTSSSKSDRYFSKPARVQRCRRGRATVSNSTLHVPHQAGWKRACCGSEAAHAALHRASSPNRPDGGENARVAVPRHAANKYKRRHHAQQMLTECCRHTFEGRNAKKKKKN